MVDLHTHILPGLDDGAVDEIMALKMMRIAADSGTKHILATPHYITDTIEYTPSFLLQQCTILNEKAKEADIDISVYPGSEVFICPELPQLIEKGSICTLNNSRYVLMELPFMSIPWYTGEVICELQSKGYVPIIAHPERNWEIIESPNKLHDLIVAGALVQVNSTSLTGLFGRKIKKAAFIFLRQGIVHFISSDAHTCGKRLPRLDKCRRMFTAKFGAKYAQELFETNGKLVLDDMHIPDVHPCRAKVKRIFDFSWLSRSSSFLVNNKGIE